MAIRIKIVEGAMNYRQSTGQIGRASVDVPGDPDRTKLAEEEAIDEKKKKVKKTAVIVLLKESMMCFPPPVHLVLS